jgi:hypothetical protein
VIALKTEGKAGSSPDVINWFGEGGEGVSLAIADFCRRPELILRSGEETIGLRLCSELSMGINLDEECSKLFFFSVCSYKVWSISGLDLVKVLEFLNISNLLVNLLYLKSLYF